MAMKLGDLNVQEYLCAFVGCANSVLGDAYTCPECDREFCADHAEPKAHQCGTITSLRPEMMAESVA